ncbi:MAG: ATP-binding protein, partial [Burkholderiales bacterium]|nr:ATP-binding protein [Burkholderiales bacterium]
AAREDDSLVVTVTDRGPGFPPAILANIGKPYQSTKGRPGAGLGLFLVVNVTRTLGGRVEVDNRREGGAVVKLTLPLSAIELGEQR